MNRERSGTTIRRITSRGAGGLAAGELRSRKFTRGKTAGATTACLTRAAPSLAPRVIPRPRLRLHTGLFHPDLNFVKDPGFSRLRRRIADGVLTSQFLLNGFECGVECDLRRDVERLPAGRLRQLPQCRQSIAPR